MPEQPVPNGPLMLGKCSARGIRLDDVQFSVPTCSECAVFAEKISGVKKDPSGGKKDPSGGKKDSSDGLLSEDSETDFVVANLHNRMKIAVNDHGSFSIIYRGAKFFKL